MPTDFGALGMSFSDFTPVYLDFAAGAEALAAGTSMPSCNARSPTRS